MLIQLNQISKYTDMWLLLKYFFKQKCQTFPSSRKYTHMISFHCDTQLCEFAQGQCLFLVYCCPEAQNCHQSCICCALQISEGLCSIHDWIVLLHLLLSSTVIWMMSSKYFLLRANIWFAIKLRVRVCKSFGLKQPHKLEGLQQKQCWIKLW